MLLNCTQKNVTCYRNKMLLLVKVFFFITLTMVEAICYSIAGVNYMDNLNFKPLKTPLPGEDPCNPLYWYPRNIPEFCNNKQPLKPGTNPYPVSLPIPVPLPPQPLPYPMPSMLPPYPIPMPVYPLPYGVPIEPTNPMLPVAAVPGPYPNPLQIYRPHQQAGMVPGIPGLVTHDGGINILPFSDVYADMLEKHKHKLIRKKLQNVLDDYDDYPRRRKRKHRRRIYF